MSQYVIVNGELYHHGVKGMRWGVRRKRKTNLREIFSIEGWIEKHQRAKDEKMLRDLTAEEIQPGRTAVNKLMRDIGKQVATRVIESTFNERKKKSDGDKNDEEDDDD